MTNSIKLGEEVEINTEISEGVLSIAGKVKRSASSSDNNFQDALYLMSLLIFAVQILFNLKAF